MNFQQYKFRPSQAGILMTNGRDKSKSLGETVLAYLDEIYIKEVHNRQKDITSKFLEKGFMVEEDSITLYSLYKHEMFFKNEERFSNDFLVGTPDIVTEDGIVDIKSCWDFHTFAKNIRSENKMYWWQLQCYMALTGKEKSSLVYCLVDTPDQLIQSELKKAMYRSGMSQDNERYKQFERDMISQLKYKDVTVEKRVYEKHYNYEPDSINQLYERIYECRKHLNTINL